MHDIWTSARALGGGGSDLSAGRFTLRWLCFVAGEGIIHIGASMPDPEAGAALLVKGCALSAIATLLFIAVIRPISQWQNAAGG